MLNTYCISAACFKRCSSPQNLSLIYQLLHLFVLMDQPVCVSLLLLEDTDGDGEKGSNVKPLSILQPVLHPAVSLAPAAFGNECFLMQTPLLISISLSLAVSSALLK